MVRINTNISIVMLERQGRIQGGGAIRAPPWMLESEEKEHCQVHHSNRRDKEEEGKRRISFLEL